MNKLNFGCGSKIFEGWTNVDIDAEIKVIKTQ